MYVQYVADFITKLISVKGICNCMEIFLNINSIGIIGLF